MSDSRDLTVRLWWAAREGNVSVARFLLDRGAEVNPRDFCSHLYIACSMSRLDVARLLIGRGADINDRYEPSLLDLVKTKFRQSGYGQKQLWAEMLTLFEPIPPPPRIRLRAHWRRRILFHVVGRRAANPGSKRHELGLYRVSTIASFLM